MNIWSRAIQGEANLEAQLDVVRQTKRQFVEAGRDLMKIIDAYTDALYGKDGAEKNNFGLPPIGVGAPGFGGPVDQVVITKIRDGSAAEFDLRRFLDDR